MPLVSVIIPVLDDADALAHLLPQCLGHGGVEVIVVDGGSRDDSRRVASAADHLIDCASGRARQLRVGVDAARGDLIWMVHADAGVSAELMSGIVDAAGESELRWGRVDVRLADAAWPFRVIEWSMNARSRLTGICTGDQGIFVRRKVLDAVGGVPLQALMEDIELSKRLRRLGRPTCLAGPIETSARRWLRDGIVRTVLRMWSFRIAYFLGVAPERLAQRYYGVGDGVPNA